MISSFIPGAATVLLALISGALIPLIIKIAPHLPRIIWSIRCPADSANYVCPPPVLPSPGKDVSPP